MPGLNGTYLDDESLDTRDYDDGTDDIDSGGGILYISPLKPQGLHDGPSWRGVPIVDPSMSIDGRCILNLGC